MEGRIKIPAIESIIAGKLEDEVPDDKKSKDKIYISQYNKFVNCVTYMSGMASICIVTATEKNILPPPGIAKKRKELLEKYKGKLHDHVVVAQIEKELLEYDKEYLKDDPSYGKIISGKVANISRKRMYLMFGTEAGFDDSADANLVEDSLYEGWPTDPDKLVDMFNSSRAGSYSRGKETQKGGVVAKVLLRSASNIMVEGEDCGTKVHLERNITKDNYTSISGRYILKGKDTHLVEDDKEAKEYIGKTVYVRSPMYCKQEGERICATCAGKLLSINPKGVSMSLTEIAAIVLYASMKKMHGKELKTTTLDLDNYLT